MPYIKEEAILKTIVNMVDVIETVTILKILLSDAKKWVFQKVMRNVSSEKVSTLKHLKNTS